MSANKQKATPSLTDVLYELKSDIMKSINCVNIGTIQAFDSADQTATIQCSIKQVVSIAEDGTKTLREKPLMLKCPVVVLSGGVAHLTMPITVGDPCLILFNDRDIDNWFYDGGVKIPNTNRVHDLSDAIAVVGVRNLQDSISGYRTDIVELRDRSGDRLNMSGDTKTSMRTANHSGWIIMDGKTIGDDASGADYEGAEYEELFVILKDVSPNTGAEVFANGDTVVVPDMRGRSAVGADNMGGSQADVLTTTYTPNRNLMGGEIGEEAHQLTVPELAIHDHPQDGKTARVPGSTITATGASGPIDLGGTTGTAGGDVPHNTVQPSKIMYWFIKI